MPIREEVGPVEFVIVMAILAVVEVLAATGAADSRDGNDWVNHRRV